jgi:hypothetical protein
MLGNGTYEFGFIRLIIEIFKTALMRKDFNFSLRQFIDLVFLGVSFI